MKNKIFTILIISMTAIMSASLIVFAALQTNSRLQITDNPEKINVYYKSQTASLTYTNIDNEYNEIMKQYNDSFKKSYLKQITTGLYLSEGTAEAIDQEGWDDTKKAKGLFLEFTYKNNQRLVVYRDGHSRQIYISGIIFELSQKNEVHKIYIHYAQDGKYNNKENAGDEILYPLTVEGDTRELYIYLRGIIDEKKNS